MLGLRILPVPRGPDGPDLAVMAQYCEAYKGQKSPQALRQRQRAAQPHGLQPVAGQRAQHVETGEPARLSYR